MTFHSWQDVIFSLFKVMWLEWSHKVLMLVPYITLCILLHVSNFYRFYCFSWLWPDENFPSSWFMTKCLNDFCLRFLSLWMKNFTELVWLSVLMSYMTFQVPMILVYDKMLMIFNTLDHHNFDYQGQKSFIWWCFYFVAIHDDQGEPSFHTWY